MNVPKSPTGSREDEPASYRRSPVRNEPASQRQQVHLNRREKHVIIIVILTVTFLAGALASGLALTLTGMRRERNRFLSNEAPTRTAHAARVISGLYVRMPDRTAHADLCHEPDRQSAPTAGPPEVKATSDRNGEPE
jgi:hypothetical protein